MLQNFCKIFIIFACTPAVYGASVCDSVYEGDGRIFDKQTERYTKSCSRHGTRIETSNQNNATTFTLTHPNQDKTRIVFSRAENLTKNVSITCTAIQPNRDIDLIHIVLEPLCPDFTSLRLRAKPSPTQALTPFLSATLQASQSVSHYRAEVDEDFFTLRYKIPSAGKRDDCLMMRVQIPDDRCNQAIISCSLRSFESKGADEPYKATIAVQTFTLIDGFHSQAIQINHLIKDNTLRNLDARSQKNTEHVIDIRNNAFYRFQSCE